MAEIFWYYARDDHQSGPVSPVELKRLAGAGELAPDDLVWKEGMDEWAAASKVKGLFPAREAGALEAEAPAARAAVGEGPSSGAGQGSGAGSGSPASMAATIIAPMSEMPSGANVAMSLAAPPLAPPTAPSSAGPLATALAAPPVAPSMPPATTTMPPLATGAPPGTGSASSTIRPVVESALTPGIRTALTTAQGILWATCVMVIILGGVLFMLTMLGAKTKAEQAESAQISGALFIGAYVLARAGERVCMLLENHLARRRR